MIFDLDGTLLDHVGAVTSALHSWLPTWGATPGDELVAAWFGAEKRHFPAWRSGEISFAEQRRRRLRDFLPWLGVTPGDDDALDAVFAGYLSCYEAAWRKFDDVEPAITALSRTGLTTAVLTNGTIDQQTAKLKAVGLHGRLGPVFTAEALGAAKPDPRTFLTVCDVLGVEPESATNVGDLYDLDVLAPRAAGLHAVYLDRQDAGPYDEPRRITSLRQLPGQLNLGHEHGPLARPQDFGQRSAGALGERLSFTVQVALAPAGPFVVPRRWSPVRRHVSKLPCHPSRPRPLPATPAAGGPP